jgi:hypothetical protein
VGRRRNVGAATRAARNDPDPNPPCDAGDAREERARTSTEFGRRGCPRSSCGDAPVVRRSKRGPVNKEHTYQSPFAARGPRLATWDAGPRARDAIKDDAQLPRQSPALRF